MTTRVRILAIGDELLTGAKRDGNSSWLAGALLEGRGLPTERIEVCGDGLVEIQEAILRLAAPDRVLLLSGGLGPTEDDRTREAIAGLAGVAVVEDPALREALAKRVAARGFAWSTTMARQVGVPEGFEALSNPVGQALGLFGRVGPSPLFAMPGVPGELAAMFREEVLPRLPQGEAALRTLTALGEPEAVLGERLRTLMAAREPQVGVTAEDGVVVVRILALGSGAAARASETGAEAAARLGPALFGPGRRTLAEVVCALLVQREVSVATAESCTGGLLASTLVSCPGISEVFLGGFVAYANAAKEAWLGVDPALLAAHGAVSSATALALARGAAARAGARLGVGVTGVAGPGGGSASRPVGTVHIALVLDGQGRGARFCFPGDRGEVRASAVREALRAMRAFLLGLAWGEDS